MTGNRTRSLDAVGVAERAARARQFLRVAELLEDGATSAERAVALSNAVEAGIAASDAICGRRLGEHSNSDRHDDAVGLLRRAAPMVPQAAAGLARLLQVKSRAQYGSAEVGVGLLAENLRRAQHLVATMERVLQQG